MNEQIFTVMEFSGRVDAMFGGSAADWSLYTQEDDSNAFMSAADAQQLQSAATPLLRVLREDQKREVRALARIIGLDVVASRI